MEIIKSVEYSQDKILLNILTLCHLPQFDIDPTYSKGVFYRNKVPLPSYKFDLYPQTSDTQQCDCRTLPFASNTQISIIFDPPFIGADIKKGKTGIIKARFGYYRKVPLDLWPFYREALTEFYRILKPGGWLVFKCQDTIEDHKQFLSHVEVINYAYSIGFYPKDLFILTAKRRLIRSGQQRQEHARKYHSYFIVFQKVKSPVFYTKNKSPQRPTANYTSAR